MRYIRINKKHILSYKLFGMKNGTLNYTYEIKISKFTQNSQKSSKISQITVICSAYNICDNKSFLIFLIQIYVLSVKIDSNRLDSVCIKRDFNGW